jgi:hypothetical protein
VRARAATVLVAALMAAYVAGYAYSASIQDTSRDVYYAYAIRHALFLPLEGPILGAALHLGPAWFYALALPLFVHESWIAAALFAGLLASLKFPFAYACGARLVDRDFGLLWAACLAAPGWPSFESLIFFNPNPAAAAVLGALLLALRVGSRPPLAWESVAFGLACALALHIHPTTAPVAILGFAFAAAARLGGGSVPRTLALMAAGFALPFLPYLASQAAGGFADSAGVASYVGGQVRAANLLGVASVLGSQFVHGPAIVAMHIGGVAAPLAVGLALVLVFPVVFTAFGWWRPRDPDFRPAAAGLALAALAFAAWIALLRPTTPVYFMYALAPFTAGLVALGLWWILRRGRGRSAAIALAAFGIAAGIAVGVRMASIVRHGEGVLTSHVLEVKRWAPAATYADTWFPASGRAALGRFLCAHPAGIAIHGPLAFVVDRAVGVDALLACRRADHVRLGGADVSVPHWAGMSRAFWSRIDSRGACRLGSLELVESVPVPVAGAGLAIPDGRKYYPREHASAPASRHSVAFEAPADHAVLIANVLHGYQPLLAIEARAGEERVEPSAANDLSMLFVPPLATRATVRWVISFDTAVPEGIDLVTFPRRPLPAPAGACR